MVWHHCTTGSSLPPEPASPKRLAYCAFGWFPRDFPRVPVGSHGILWEPVRFPWNMTGTHVFSSYPEGYVGNPSRTSGIPRTSPRRSMRFGGMPWGPEGIHANVTAGLHGNCRETSHGFPWAPTRRPTGCYSRHSTVYLRSIASVAGSRPSSRQYHLFTDVYPPVLSTSPALCMTPLAAEERDRRRCRLYKHCTSDQGELPPTTETHM